LNPNLDITTTLSCDVNMSLLALAVSTGDHDAVNLLLDVGAHVDRGCLAHSTTPLLFAACARQDGMVQSLVAAGADLRAASTQGYTALHCALSPGRVLPTVACKSFQLPECGAAEWQRRGHNILQMLCAAGSPLDSLNSQGLAPLHMAAAEGDVTAIRLLVAAGANAQQCSGLGSKPLAFALREGHHKAAAVLRKLSK
jgi:uncharacterized protein